MSKDTEHKFAFQFDNKLINRTYSLKLKTKTNHSLLRSSMKAKHNTDDIKSLTMDNNTDNENELSNFVSTDLNAEAKLIVLNQAYHSLLLGLLDPAANINDDNLFQIKPFIKLISNEKSTQSGTIRRFLMNRILV